MSSNADQQAPLLKSSNQLVSLTEFLAITWTGFALCILAFGFRAYVRHSVFRRLFVDDWLMIFALVLLAVSAATQQRTLKHIYTLMAVGNLEQLPGPTFFDDATVGMNGFSTSLVCYIIGVYIVKFNFLVFFYRIGSQITRYLVLWYIVSFINLACCASTIGIMPFRCLFRPLVDIIWNCRKDYFRQIILLFKVSCILDVISDALVLGFPLTILWKVRISRRKKLLLGAVFGLVVFTIAVTIIRGSIFGGIYKSSDQGDFTSMNLAWIWFWYHTEFTVSILISCIVSFRALFSRQNTMSEQDKAREYREKKLREEIEGKQAASGSNNSSFRKMTGRLRDMHSSFLNTCRALEWTVDDEGRANFLPMPPSHRLSLDFSGQGRDMWDGSNVLRMDSLGKTAHGQDGSSI